MKLHKQIKEELDVIWNLTEYVYGYEMQPNRKPENVSFRKSFTYVASKLFSPKLSLNNIAAYMNTKCNGLNMAHDSIIHLRDCAEASMMRQTEKDVILADITTSILRSAKDVCDTKLEGVAHLRGAPYKKPLSYADEVNKVKIKVIRSLEQQAHYAKSEVEQQQFLSQINELRIR
jgi:hypothetical protein